MEKHTERLSSAAIGDTVVLHSEGLAKLLGPPRATRQNIKRLEGTHGVKHRAPCAINVISSIDQPLRERVKVFDMD